MKTLNRSIHFMEDSLLIILVVSMIVLATGQIGLRNFFDVGIVWIDPLLRVLVLWTGLIGATVASRSNKHIRIDLLSHFFKKRVHMAMQSFIALFTTLVCAVIAWHGARWVYMDYADSLTAFAGLPAWALELIIPIAFGLIAMRYTIHCVQWFRMFLLYPNHDPELNPEA